jgi:hypothetical protein
MEVIRIQECRLLSGGIFEYSDELKEFCMDILYSSVNHLDKIYAIYNYSEMHFAVASKEAGLFNDLEMVSTGSISIPNGDYVISNIENYDSVGEFLIQTSYRIDHKRFLYIEEYDLNNKSIKIYNLLRNNGLDLNSIQRCSKEQSLKLRSEYMHHFTNRSSVNQGGYVWEDFRDFNIISMDEVKIYLDQRGPVLFFWDSHPDFPLLNALGKEWVFLMDDYTLLQHYMEKNVPDDIYIFDETLSWTIALTHEPQDENGWKNLKLGMLDRNKIGS